MHSRRLCVPGPGNLSTAGIPGACSSSGSVTLFPCARAEVSEQPDLRAPDLSALTAAKLVTQDCRSGSGRSSVVRPSVQNGHKKLVSLSARTELRQSRTLPKSARYQVFIARLRDLLRVRRTLRTFGSGRLPVLLVCTFKEQRGTLNFLHCPPERLRVNFNLKKKILKIFQIPHRHSGV